MSKFQCVNKECPACNQVFEWDNVLPGVVCRTCGNFMDGGKAAPAKPKGKEADDE